MVCCGPQSLSEQLTQHHGGNSRENGDAKSRQRVLALGNGDTGNHTGTNSGNSQLLSQFLGAGRGQLHNALKGCADRRKGCLRGLNRSVRLLRRGEFLYLAQSLGLSAPVGLGLRWPTSAMPPVARGRCG